MEGIGGEAISFIAEGIEVLFDGERGFEKRPVCPAAFVWRGHKHTIEECLSEWKDYVRRGKMAHNMQPAHLVTAEKRGSRGVGRYYFRVRTSERRVFDMYYDRSPRNVQDHKGGWYLLREMSANEKGL